MHEFHFFCTSQAALTVKANLRLKFLTEPVDLSKAGDKLQRLSFLWSLGGKNCLIRRGSNANKWTQIVQETPAETSKINYVETKTVFFSLYSIGIFFTLTQILG